MENRCNGDAGKFKSAELLPTKLVLSVMLKKSYLGREPLRNSDQNGHPDQPSKANWPICFRQRRNSQAALKLSFKTGNVFVCVQHSAIRGEYLSLVR